MLRISSKESLYKAVEGFLKHFEVIGPKELPGKGIFYQPITNTADLYLGTSPALEPVKKFFFQPAECLFDAGLKKAVGFLDGISLTQDQRLIFGVRPCEARGLVLLDKVFNSEYKDASYISRRERTIIVGLSCLEPGKNCFCTSVGGSPTGSRGMDAIISSIEEDFVIEAITEKGKDILGSIGKPITKEEEKNWHTQKENRNNALKRKINLPKGLESIFESDYWEKVSFPCISCGVCTYLCPTCHCFDLADEGRKRLRCYDGCSFSDFTLEASGVNPRPSKKERYRQRVFHKFDYFKKNFGEDLCVGCGRCISHCPVKMDIAEIIEGAA